jgi:oxygen-independent coproporphyrinogen III oxidase
VGVNRISFGAQSFDPAVLKLLGRIHDVEATRAAVRASHQAGFERLNLDLMFAVPGQTLQMVGADLAAAVALEPDHISAYNLTFEEGTPFFSDMKRGRIRPLPSDDQAAMFERVREYLPRHGYPMYEVSNYAAAGHEARHNLSYWRAESYLGIGAGAFSYGGQTTGSRRWWNERSPSRYIEIASKAGNPEAGFELVDQQTAMGEFIFLNLRLSAGFTTAEFERRFGQSFERKFGKIASRLADDGLLIRRDGRMFLSDRGLELGDSVFAEFV